MRFIIIFALGVFFDATFLYSQPYWVANRTIKNNLQYYYGIGSSKISEKAADDEAYIQFSKMIEVKIQSTTERFLEENKDNISDLTINSTKIETDIKLRGIAITERFYDEKNKIFYSKIEYPISMYESILKRELKSEIEILIEKNKNEERRKLEGIRNIEELSKIVEAEKIAKFESDKREDKIQQLQKERELEYEKFMNQFYKLFYDKPVSPFLINFQNAELGLNNHEFILKPTVNPVSFIQTNYSFYTKYLGFSLGFYLKDKKVEEQDFQAKLRILKEKFGIYPVSLALGVVQYSYNISGFSEFNKIKWGFSPSFMMNISFPQIYSTASVYAESRKMILGFQHYLFFEELKGKFSLMLQSSFWFNTAFSDSFGNKFILEPGITFEVIENYVLFMISYEHNEFLTLTFDFKL